MILMRLRYRIFVEEDDAGVFLYLCCLFLSFIPNNLSIIYDDEVIIVSYEDYPATEVK